MGARHWVIVLNKEPYLVAYPCCDVLDLGLETTRCWSCGEHGGYSLMDIPKWNRDLYQGIYLLCNPARGVAVKFSNFPEGMSTWHP